MRVLRDAPSINAEMQTCNDSCIARLLARYLNYLNAAEDSNAGSIRVILVEPGDTLQAIDTEMQQGFLTNAFSGKHYGEPGFVPPFETLEEHLTLYEMFFIEGGGEAGISILIPKGTDIDRELLALCAANAVPAREVSP